LISYLGVRVRAQLKAMTVMQSYLAQRAATAAGADDAILVDDEGRIFEGATSNMFLVRSGGLVTPPAEGAILPGVLRAKVEELASAHGIPVVEAFARIADLRPDDGMLLTSSVRGIVPVGSVDGRDLRVDEVLLGRLRALVGEAEEASIAAFRDAYR
jgi:branched-subunit amino acid aminotransferase/4-amino-4-deoxychorismate lyase